jgi:hypothetical protein
MKPGNADLYDDYDFRGVDGTQSTQIERINTGFFPGGKS